MYCKIIDESIHRILTNGRCLSYKGSEYIMDVKRCPVGHYLINPRRVPARKVQSWTGNYNKFFIEQYRGLPLEFWQDLQNLHDWDFLWYRDDKNKTVLSRNGKYWVDKIKNKWKTKSEDEVCLENKNNSN